MSEFDDYLAEVRKSADEIERRIDMMRQRRLMIEELTAIIEEGTTQLMAHRLIQETEAVLRESARD